MVNRLRLSPLAALRGKQLTDKPHPAALASFGVIAALVVFGIGLQIFGDPNGGRPRISMAFELDELDYESILRLAQGNENTPVILRGSDVSETELLPGEAEADVIRLGQLGTRNPNTHVSDGSPISLRPAPAPGLYAAGINGVIPVIGPNGERPADIYARPFNHADARPRVALIIGGLGLNQDTTLAAINNLPGEVTLSFAPYAEDLQLWINRARAAGHEVIIEIPMEPYDYPDNDPGPATLLTSNEWEANANHLDWVLSRASGYVGVMNYQGARLTADEETFMPVLQEVAAHGLLYLDDGASQRSLTARLGATSGGSWAVANRRIDLRPSQTNIDNALLDLEGTAVSDGVAIGVGFAYPVTVEQIVAWAETLEAKGISLAPLSAVALSETS